MRYQTTLGHSGTLDHISDDSDRPRGHGRAMAEILISRADLLSRQERALFRAAMEDGKSAAELGLLTGSDPRGMRRRLRRVASRLSSPMFLFVATHRSGWPAQRRDVATAVYLQGHTLRAAAGLLDLPIHTVRKHMVAVRALFEAAMAVR